MPCPYKHQSNALWFIKKVWLLMTTSEWEEEELIAISIFDTIGILSELSDTPKNVVMSEK